MKTTSYLAAVFALFSPLAALHAAAPSAKPNIVLIMADDQGWGDTGYNGHPELKTPNLDALAASGLRLDRFYAAHCNCSPTRGSVMTGRHPNRYGTFHPNAPIRVQELTVAKVLQAAGYATGHFGKWHLNGKGGDKNTTTIPGRAILANDPLSPGKMGFDEWVSADNFFDLDPVLGRDGVPEKFHGDSSDVTTDEALKFIRKQAAAGKPFLTVVWFGSPHVPHLALPADKAAYSALSEKEQNYFGEITAVDRNVGRLRAALRELKVADNTILWYCSDNGGHEGPKSTGNLRGEKGSLWEGGLRVPGIVEWPARIAKPFISGTPCSTIDIYPTVLEATGAVAQHQIQPLDGVSLIPLFEHKTESRTKPLPFWDHGTGHAAWLDWPYKLHTNPVTTRYTKSKQDRDLPATLLYDLSKDPKETTDLAAQEPERVAKMTAALQAWKASVEKSLSGADYGGQPMDIGPKKKKRLSAKVEAQSATLPKESIKPNILHIHADDHRADGLHSLGNPLLQTPNLDSLVERGMTFSHCYTMGSMTGAVCTPSRTMMLTGRSWQRIPGAPGAAPNAKDATTCLPRVIQAAGYQTWHMGKYGNGFPEGLVEFETTIRDDAHGKTPQDDRAHCSQRLADKTIGFLKSRTASKETKPFYIYIAPPVPHDPRSAEPQFHKLYDPANIPLSPAFMPQHPFDNGEMTVRDEKLAPWPRTPADTKQQNADYYSCVTGLDHHVGRIFTELKASGQWDNTIIIFSGDNGLSLGEHGLFGKQNLYEFGGMHVPLIVAGPGIAKGKSEAFVYLMDLFPTFAEFAGAKIPDGVEGKSIVPILTGKQTKVRDVLYTAYRDCMRAIRDDRWKLIRYPLVDRTQLFDLSSDPHELVNLADKPEHAAKVAELTTLLTGEMASHADKFPLTGTNLQRAEWSPPAPGDKPARQAKKKPAAESTAIGQPTKPNIVYILAADRLTVPGLLIREPGKVGKAKKKTANDEDGGGLNIP